jgi:serine/threonine protein kinase
MSQPSHSDATVASKGDANATNERRTQPDRSEQQDTLLLSEVPDAFSLMPEASEAAHTAPSSDGPAVGTKTSAPQFPSIDLTPLSQRYELLAEAGHGSMGNVYKARDRETGETVALKLLKPEIASDQTMMERFKKELLFARKITHKNVCRVHEFNRIGGIAYTSMEFVEGDSLRSVLNRFGGLPVRKALDLALQMCSALQEAHAQGIVHRDLKPENVMIDTQGNVKIMDFGIARSMDAMTRLTGSMVGTPAYMAPEQVSGKQVDYRTDIYALGLILYEMFTGQPAFQAENAVAVALKQLREAPKPPREVKPWVPVEIERAILKCLEKEPARRFQSIAQLVDALRPPAATAPQTGRVAPPATQKPSFAAHPPSGPSAMPVKDPYKPSQPIIPGVPATALEKKRDTSLPPPAVAPEESKQPRELPRGLWIAAGALAALLVGGGLWFWSSSPTPQSALSQSGTPSDSVANESPKPSSKLPIAPGIVGTTKELAKPWSAKRFLFRGPVSADPVPGIVVHLPNGQYWGFSLIEPFGTCELEYVTDLHVLQAQYGYRAGHPMVADPCTHAVYDLLQYGTGANDGGLVRGAIVQGAGIRPPMAIEIEVKGKQVRAIRME